jgi:hypothetical protein
MCRFERDKLVRIVSAGSLRVAGFAQPRWPPAVLLPAGRILPLTALWFLASILFFARSYSNYFVSDDYQFLGRINFQTAQPYLTHSWGYGHEYRPLAPYSYALDAVISRRSPVGYHLTNTLLHAGTALLLVLTLLNCGWPLLNAAAAGVIFLINPVTHESVLWISGRTVVLSTFFVALGLWSLVKAGKAQSPPAALWALSYGAFVAALLAYEGAVIFPLLAVLLWFSCLDRRSTIIPHLVGYSLIALAYIASWVGFFGLHITRFPVETSASGGLHSLAQCVLHTFHGSQRIEAAPVYLCLLAVLISSKPGRKVLAFGAAWLLVAYLPFFIVHGFADRFAYLGSVAAAVILSVGAYALSERWHRAGLVFLFALLLFFGVGMQNRITIWKESGSLARSIVQDIKSARPTLPEGATLVLLDVPMMHKHAVLFMFGLERAVKLAYPATASFTVRREMPAPDAPDAGPLIVFRYVTRRMTEVPASAANPTRFRTTWL